MLFIKSKSSYAPTSSCYRTTVTASLHWFEIFSYLCAFMESFMSWQKSLKIVAPLYIKSLRFTGIIILVFIFLIFPEIIQWHQFGIVCNILPPHDLRQYYLIQCYFYLLPLYPCYCELCYIRLLYLHKTKQVKTFNNF